jgi:hypothetical protein
MMDFLPHLFFAICFLIKYSRPLNCMLPGPFNVPEIWHCNQITPPFFFGGGKWSPEAFFAAPKCLNKLIPEIINCDFQSKRWIRFPKYGSGAPKIWIRCTQNSLKILEGAEVSNVYAIHAIERPVLSSHCGIWSRIHELQPKEICLGDKGINPLIAWTRGIPLQCLGFRQKKNWGYWVDWPPKT